MLAREWVLRLPSLPHKKHSEFQFDKETVFEELLSGYATVKAIYYIAEIIFAEKEHSDWLLGRSEISFSER